MSHHGFRFFVIVCATFALLSITLYLAMASQGASSPTGPKLWVTPLVLDFGPVGVGFASPTQAVTITNLGSATLTNFAGGGVYPPFHASQNCAGGVPPGGKCQYFFTFRPSAVGSFSTTSNSSTNAGSFSIELRGTGVGAGLAVSALSLNFGSVYIDGGPATQAVEIRNTGMSTLTNFAGGGVHAPFGASQNCAGGVAPGGKCQYFFTFDPSAVGAFSTTSSSSTNAGSFTIALKGSGRSIMLTSGQYATPLIIDFGPVGVNTLSAPRTVSITNQSWQYAITNWRGGDAYLPFYSSPNTCAPSLAALGQCTYSFRFGPWGTEVFTTLVGITNSMGSFSIELRGTGVGAGLAVSPLALDFGPVALGVTSPPQTVTIRNTGMTTLTNFAGGGLYLPFWAGQTCAAGVAPGGKCIYVFKFTPQAPGRYSATSTTSTNAGSFSIRVFGGEPLPLYLPLLLCQ